ncbi:hypothetical protein O6P43_030507 [Quillaja saponaria]|uniref:Uncharacterized protein n=1 Tax=Quillaja saponaria TaxID=32244 RepID=A0AAD7P801_QUISA|nr:hypothetical protein O6P43_030507 [Quillaja saponaria]
MPMNNDQYQVYEASTLEYEPRRYTDSPRHPKAKAHVTFKTIDHAEERIPEASPSSRQVRRTDYLYYDQVPPPQSIKNDGRIHRVIEEDVDEEADEFIKLQHKRIELSRLVSTRAE